MSDNTNKLKKQNLKINLVTLSLIVIILILSLLGAYALYTTSQSKNVSVEIAAWKFNVDLRKKDGVDETDNIINLAQTILNTEEISNYINGGSIAPGTYGAFDLVMNGSTTDVGYDYYININTNVNKIKIPRNLKFYRLKSGKEEGVINAESLEDTNEETARFEQVGTDGSIRIAGDVAKRTDKRERIYWIWPYETKVSYMTKDEADDIDTEDSENSKTVEVSLPIKVTAEQRTANENKKLAYIVKVGDIVNYSAPLVSASGTAEDHINNLSGTSIVDNNGNVASLSTKENMGIQTWKVLSIDGDTVNLVASDITTTKVKLGNKNAVSVEDKLKVIDAYYNAEDALNNVCKIFKNDTYAIDARSIQIEDIEQYYKPNRMGVLKNIDTISDKKYGEKYTNNDNIVARTLKVPGNASVNLESDYVEKLTGQRENPVQIDNLIQSVYWTKNEENTLKYLGNNNIIYKMLFKNSNNDNLEYWLASCCKILNNNSSYFCMYACTSGCINRRFLYHSAGEVNPVIDTHAILPVVSLKSSIRGTLNDGIWEISN